jgi:hypothetical protein
MKLLIALALTAAPSALAMAPYVPIVDDPTAAPSTTPTKDPTAAPTKDPTPAPTKEPTPAPTKEPTPAPFTVPAGCMETPGGNLIKEFELDDVCLARGPSYLLFSNFCDFTTDYLLECYDACVDYGLTLDPVVEYKWADTGPGFSFCGHGKPVDCMCHTECPFTVGQGKGLIVGPCGAPTPAVP